MWTRSMSSVGVTLVLLAISCAQHVFPAVGRHLVKNADHVVVGTATALVKIGRQAAFQLEVERSLKGDLPPRNVIPVECDTGTYRAQWKDPAPPMRGIWFLRGSESGRWECLPVDHTIGMLSYPVPKRAVPPELRYEDSVEVLDKVILEAGAAALEAVENNPHSYLVFVLREAAENYDSPSVRRLFRQWGRSSSLRLKAFGLAELIKRGDVAALLQLEEEVKTLPLSPEVEKIVAMFDWIRDPNPDTIRVLGRLATSESPILGLQVAAAGTLRAMHTKETLPYLAALLESPNAELRAAGVLGLGFFANGSPIVTPEGIPRMDFLNKRVPNHYTTKETEEYFGLDPAREQEYVAFWKGWWLQHQAELAQ